MQIETLFHRTLGYIFLSFIAVFSYAAIFMVITRVFKYSNKFAGPIVDIVLLVTFIVFFNVFKDKILKFVNRLFYRKRYEYMEVINSFVEKLHLLIDIDELLPMIVDTVNEAMQVERVCVLLLDEDGKEYTVRVHRGMENPAVRLSRDDPFATWIFSQRKLVEKEQIGVDPWYSRMKDVGLARFKELEAEICIPLIAGNQMIGMLNLGRKVSGEPYRKGDIDLLSSLGAQSAIALSNATTYNSLKKRTDQLHLLSTLGQDMGQSLDLDTVLRTLIEKTKELMHAEIISVLLKDEQTGELVIKASSGLDEKIVRETRIKSGENISGWVARHAQAMLVHDIELDPRFRNRSHEKYYTKSLISAPLIIKGRIIGVVNVNNRDRRGAFTSYDVELLRGICGEVAAIIENARLYTDLRKSYLRTIQALAQAMDAKDPYTYGHSARVTEYALKIARGLDLSDDDVENIASASLLHDLGKIGIEDSILLKPDKLTEEEYEKVKSHPETSEKIVKPIGLPEGVLSVIRHHHEWYNGTGYPDGLSEGKIPLGARVLSIADAYDAMTSDRPYRKALTKKQAIEELKKYNYEQFDPQVVGVFLKILVEKKDGDTSVRKEKQRKSDGMDSK